MGKRRKKPTKAEAARSRFVLDSSVALSWYFADETNPYADQVAQSLANADAIVPSLWPLEIANALLVGERRGRSSPAQATAFLARLSNLPILLDVEPPSTVWSQVLPLARAHELSAYDAAYLELAIREELAFATLENRLRIAAGTLGIVTHEP